MPEPLPEPPLAVPPSPPDGLHAKGNRTVTPLRAAAFGSNRHGMTVSELLGLARTTPAHWLVKQRYIAATIKDHGWRSEAITVVQR
jgi:hypothetical protein